MEVEAMANQPVLRLINEWIDEAEVEQTFKFCWISWLFVKRRRYRISLSSLYAYIGIVNKNNSFFDFEITSPKTKWREWMKKVH